MVQLSFKEKGILLTDLLTIIIVNLFIFFIFPNDSFWIYTFIASIVYIIFNSLFSLRVTRNLEFKWFLFLNIIIVLFLFLFIDSDISSYFTIWYCIFLFFLSLFRIYSFIQWFSKLYAIFIILFFSVTTVLNFVYSNSIF